MFRDGVSEGFFSSLMADNFAAIRQVCLEMAIPRPLLIADNLHLYTKEISDSFSSYVCQSIYKMASSFPSRCRLGPKWGTAIFIETRALFLREKKLPKISRG